MTYPTSLQPHQTTNIVQFKTQIRNDVVLFNVKVSIKHQLSANLSINLLVPEQNNINKEIQIPVPV